MREPDVVAGEATFVRLESRIVVGRRRPVGTRRSRLEVSTTPEAVALGHLATQLDELAVPGELPQDSSNSEPLERLKCEQVIGRSRLQPASCAASRASDTAPTGVRSVAGKRKQQRDGGTVFRRCDHAEAIARHRLRPRRSSTKRASASDAEVGALAAHTILVGEGCGRASARLGHGTRLGHWTIANGRDLAGRHACPGP